MICEKVKYGSYLFAMEDIKRIKKISTRDKVPCRAYLCKCGYWHLTSEKYNNVERIAKLEEEIIKLREEKAKSNKEAIHEAKVNDKVQALNKYIAKQNKLIKHLRAENSRNISKIIQLEKNK